MGGGIVCEPEPTSIAQGVHAMLRVRTPAVEQEERDAARACASLFEWRHVAARLRERYAALLEGRPV